jgi:CubicO group peptidase (beta-lactamase class C family)
MNILAGNRKRILAFAGAIFVAQSIPCAAAESDGPAEALASLESKTADAERMGFGGAILIEEKGKIILRRGYGFADREKKIRFAPETIAQIGSVTKSMTALAILELAHAGKIDLEKPVKTYLSDAADPAGSATLRQILTHHAGLADTCGDDFDHVSTEYLLHTCMARALAFSPGGDHYSNMGYSILAAVVERVSGQSWETFLRQQIWQPLAMRRTGFTHFDGIDANDFAHGYLNGKVQNPISENIAALGGDDWNLRGNGGIEASALDMERYYRGLTGRLPGIPSDVATAMTTPHDPMSGEAWEGYGLFVRLDAHNRPYRIGFSGSDGIFFSYFGWLPQQDVFFYVVGNNGEANVKPVVVAVLGAALKIAGITPDMLQSPPVKK